MNDDIKKFMNDVRETYTQSMNFLMEKLEKKIIELDRKIQSIDNVKDAILNNREFIDLLADGLIVSGRVYTVSNDRTERIILTVNDNNMFDRHIDFPYTYILIIKPLGNKLIDENTDSTNGVGIDE